MIDRRLFLKTVVAAAGTGVAVRAAGHSETGDNFGLHPFVEEHPEAVFIMKTNLPAVLGHEDVKYGAGYDFTKNVFVRRGQGGLPFDTTVVIKPNFKGGTSPALTRGDEVFMGSSTNIDFTEGVIDALKDLGLPPGQIPLREAYPVNRVRELGWFEMAEKTGVSLPDLSVHISNLTEGEHYHYDEVEDGIWYKRLTHHTPINHPGTFLLDISKFKSHLMGLTLCCKNLQGSIARSYQALCTRFGLRQREVPLDDIYPDAYDVILANYNRHLKEGHIPRWDLQEAIDQECWATRTLENISTFKTPQLHVIEGLWGMDGMSAENGPHPLDKDYVEFRGGRMWYYEDGEKKVGMAKCFLSNFILFGLNPIKVDIMGHWLGKHEPGNFGFFHIAMERGFTDHINPRNIPVYLWENGTATRIPMESLERTPLLTHYLCKDPSVEPYYRLLDEPYDYPTDPAVKLSCIPSKPCLTVRQGCRPDALNHYAAIEYSIPACGDVSLDVYDIYGNISDILVRGRREAGAHSVNWNIKNKAPGMYFCRMKYGDYEKMAKLRFNL